MAVRHTRSEYATKLIKSGVRGKYAKRYREEGANVVLLEPEPQELESKHAEYAKPRSER